jgi:hypothetical protein
MQIDFHDLLVATSVLVGFQVTLFIWRIDREVEKKPEQHSWLPPSDWLGGLSMLCFVVGGLLLPIVGAVDFQTAKNFFGLGALLTIGHLFGLVGHYETFYDQSAKPCLVPTSGANRALALCHTDNFVLLARLEIQRRLPWDVIKNDSDEKRPKLATPTHIN